MSQFGRTDPIWVPTNPAGWSQQGTCFMLGQKQDVICCLAENKIVLEVAAEFGISHRQVYDIWKQIRTANDHDHEEDCIVQGR